MLGEEPHDVDRERSNEIESSETTDEHRAKLPKIIGFRELCRCGDEIWIENDGQLYRLRRTKQGKLILTK